MKLFYIITLIMPYNLLESISDTSSDGDNSDILDYGSPHGVDDFADMVYWFDMDYLDIPKVHDKYYIGRYELYEIRNTWILSLCISSDAFFKFEFKAIQEYAYEFGTQLNTINDIGIMKLHIGERDGTYHVTIKTYWLRIVQRTWKRVYAERKKCLALRRTLPVLRYFELHGRYPYPCRSLHSIHGMIQN